MQVSIYAVDFVLTHAMRARLEEQLAFALAWTERQTARLRGMLSRVAGPGGQILTCCKIHVQLRDGQTLVVENTRADMQLAAEHSASRIDRFMRQALRRRRPARGASHVELSKKMPPWTK